MSKCLAVLLAGFYSISAGQSGAGPSDDIYQAIHTNDLARLKALVPTAAEANAPSLAGAPPLMVAAAAGSIDAMTLLLDRGADVNAQNALGSTALIWSATDLAK